MHAETFLREFAPLASGPGGIQKLRELVLRLAMRGKLAPQNASEGHAEAILAKIANDADSATKKRIAKYGSIDPIYPTPNNWAWTTIGRMSRDWGQKVPDKPFHYIDVGGIDNLKGQISHKLELLQPEDAPSRARKRIARGTVLFSTVRPYLKNIAVVDREFAFEAIASTAFAIVHPLGGIIPEYVFYYLRSPDFVVYVEGQMMGVAYPAINDSKFFAAPIPLPPLAEQKRIVAKVDELMALCDELEAQQAEQTELKRAFSASALHHLTEARTLEETADRWSLLAPRFGELFDELETISQLKEALLKLSITGLFDQVAGIEGKRAEEIPIGEIVSVVGGSTPSKQQSDYWGGDIPWISPKDMKVAEINDAVDHVTEKAVAMTNIKLLSPGSVLTVVRGMILAKTLPVAVLRSSATINQDMKALIPKDGIISEYLALVLNGSKRKILGVIERSTHGTCRLETGKLLSIPIRKLQVRDQRRLVAKVDELMSLCDSMEEQVRERERLNAELMASLVHALTEPDPDGGGAVVPASFTEDSPTYTTPEAGNGHGGTTPETKSVRTTFLAEPESRAAPARAPGVDIKFQEAVLVTTIVNTFFQVGGEPIGNFRLQKAVYFARRKMGEHVGEMDYLKKAAGPYNPSMKYSGGIAIAKQKNWLREARGRFGFGHVPGPAAEEIEDWFAKYGFGDPARWVAEHFRFKRNEEWETLATVDYAMEHLQSLGIEADAGQVLQYIRADDEWRPKIEKLRLTEMSVGNAMLEVKALFSAEGGDGSA